MKIKETALFLTGFQNDFCSEDGALYEAVKEVLTKNNTIANTVDLLEKLRGKGMLILFTPIVFTSDFRELRNPVGILKAIKDLGAFRKGTKGCEMIEELEPFADDITIVPGKRGLCGFGNTAMDSILESNGIKNVVLAGLLTNICVESTARTAYDKGYEVIVLKDCTACKSLLEQKFAEENIFPLLGTVMNHDELLEQLE